jgi:hypothetical protein
MRWWHRNRTDYFTQGMTDGHKAAFQSLPTVGVDTALVREQAQFAAAALPRRVGADDERIYQSGWIEGYNTMHDRAPQTSDAPVT